MTDELKPCPWCNGNAHVRIYMRDATSKIIDGYSIECDDCHIDPDIYDAHEEEAIKQWNTRPIEDALVKALEAMIDLVNADRQDAVECDKMARAALALAKGGNDAQ